MPLELEEEGLGAVVARVLLAITWVQFPGSNALGCRWSDAICDALVLFSCYHHTDMEG